jgi:RNA polymerase sigma-70 factor (ECF subfamily)
MPMQREEAFELAADGKLSDEALVARIRAGEAALFEVLMRRHNRRVYRAVRGVLRDEAEAEDAMQQAYVSAFTHLSDFAGGARFSTWLVRIALNEALGRLRRSARVIRLDDLAGTGESEENMAGPSARATSPEHDAALHELAAYLERALDELPETYRTVFMLREVEGLSSAEAAEVLGVSEEVVRTRLHRARTRIRDLLDARLGEATAEAFQFGDRRCDRVVAGVWDTLRTLLEPA